MIVFDLSYVIDNTEAKIGDFKIEYLREFQAVCKKSLTREPGGLGEVV
jgi:hypothetical protein